MMKGEDPTLMTLRTRLALVLVALVVAPLVAAGVLVLYAVPRAAADRADSLVQGTRSAVTDELRQQCDAVGTAAVVAGRMLGPSSPREATRTAVADGLADWVSVIDRRARPSRRLAPCLKAWSRLRGPTVSPARPADRR
jgi:hypothetical protein